MDQETVDAVRREVQTVATQMMDAMALLGALIYASGNISKSEFLGISRKFAAGCRGEGKQIAGALIEGMCARLDAMDELHKRPPEGTH